MNRRAMRRALLRAHDSLTRKIADLETQRQDLSQGLSRLGDSRRLSCDERVALLEHLALHGVPFKRIAGEPHRYGPSTSHADESAGSDE